MLMCPACAGARAQVYLGGYEQEEHAAEAYDVAALKCKGRKVRAAPVPRLYRACTAPQPIKRLPDDWPRHLHMHFGTASFALECNT